LCLVLEYFSTVLISTYERGWWCAALLWFLSLRLVLRVFFIPNFYLWKQGLSDVLLFCDSFLCLVLRVFFNSPTQFLPMKGLSDVLLFCDSFLYVWS
jgi:hypothetical protein